MGHAPPRPRPLDDTSQLEEGWSIVTVMAGALGPGLVIVGLITGAAPLIVTGVAITGLRFADRIGERDWGFPHQIPARRKPIARADGPFAERAKADYVAGKIEIEQLEIDLEQALAGRIPERMRPAGPPRPADSARSARAPNGAPRTPQIVGRRLGPPPPYECEEHGHQFEVGHPTCVICGEPGPYTEYR